MVKRIGIIREGKKPVDRRVPLIPEQAKRVQEEFPNVKVVCQKSDIRCYTNEEYHLAGIELVEDVSDCDILLGVKEVPVDELIENKTYLFFSHTIKEQSYNRGLLQAILQKNIRLIDYETLTNNNGQRVVAFGRYAGLVGAYNALWTYGKRYNLYHLKRAYECYDLDELKSELKKVNLPPIKIVITGGGRVAKGAIEILHALSLIKVTPARFLTNDFTMSVYTQLNSRDYHVKIDGGEFIREEFYKHPERFTSDFVKYTRQADLLIACAYWDPRAPALFDRKDIINSDFNIRIIADITCDIEGSIPSTKRPATIQDPVYDYEPTGDTLEPPFSDEGNITVMAVDNLPCELPRNASEDFGREILNHVLPSLLEEDREGMIERATIAQKGVLMPKFSYLQEYVEGKIA
jgi:saccharopine dehydrogenase (NAD+, L-lysine forming)